MAEKMVHLVYIHGFQGNDTTFQSFPTDLQHYLSTHIAQSLNITIQSSLYPTYRSIKPISYATRNFLEWLSTQPPGPVILLGHSMGGLLAAEAATDPSNKKNRIIGMIAFDTPYLGMHPHVVVSGIASLFPKDDDDNKKSEGELNDPAKVTMVDQKVTDDWEGFKKDMPASQRPTSVASNSNSQLSTHTLSSPSAQFSPLGTPIPLVDRGISFLSSHANDPLIKWVRKHSDEPFTAGKQWIKEHFQFGSCMFDPTGLKDRYTKLVGWDGLWINYWTQTVPRLKTIEGQSTAKDVPPNLDVADNDTALLETVIPAVRSDDGSGITSPPSPVIPSPITSPALPEFGPPTKSDLKSLEKERQKNEKRIQKEQQASEKARVKAEKERMKAEKRKLKQEKEEKYTTPHHFIVLPTGIGQVLGGWDHWEEVRIAGVEDEVAAHTGLFIPGQNLDYPGFVEKVGKGVLRWCEKL